MEVPLGFEQLRRDIPAAGDEIADMEKIPDERHMGLFSVYTSSNRGLYQERQTKDANNLVDNRVMASNVPNQNGLGEVKTMRDLREFDPKLYAAAQKASGKLKTMADEDTV
ncbi:hypothetical protein PT974_05120 [Cladobotryum mycophilum]|uniref:Uncharacterized protein n=1 Tax=Cladobotryum mycophilum TaxID=491253 RepID=A0ABR0SR99_9HYPO